MKPEVPPREWLPASAARLRDFRHRTKDEMIEQLKAMAPVEATVDELIKEPAESIVRRELIKKGYEQCLARIFELSEDVDNPTIANNGEFQQQ